MRRDALAGSLRRLADRAHHAFPQLVAHHHIRDAASVLDAGNVAGAQRHLNAAIASFTPQSVSRSGLADDADHQAARKLMGETHRHLLLVKDASDAPDTQPATQLANRSQGIELARKALNL